MTITTKLMYRRIHSSNENNEIKQIDISFEIIRNS